MWTIISSTTSLCLGKLHHWLKYNFELYSVQLIKGSESIHGFSGSTSLEMSSHHIYFNLFSQFLFTLMQWQVALSLTESSLPNLKATSFALYTVCLLRHVPAVRDRGEEERGRDSERVREGDVLTLWIHFKIWQRANGRTAGRQINRGPSHQVVLGQIGCGSVQPLDILPTLGGQDGIHKLSWSRPQHTSLQPDSRVHAVYCQGTHWADVCPKFGLISQCVRPQAVVCHHARCHHWDKPFVSLSFSREFSSG